MQFDSEIPKAIAKACSSTASPYDIGLSVGRLLYNIKALVEVHLDNALDCELAVPASLKWAPDFVHAIADCMFNLRTTHNLPDALEAIPLGTYDRKARTKQRKCREKYIGLVEKSYKQCVHKVLGELFASWDPVKTQEFNKGVDRALTRTEWKMYPLSNVVLEVKDGDWEGWLTERCEEMNWKAMKAHEGVVGKRSRYEMWKMCDERWGRHLVNHTIISKK